MEFPTERLRTLVRALTAGRLHSPWWTLVLLAVPVLIWIVLGPLSGPGTSYRLPETVEFNRDVRPILSQNCFACHGPDANAREADLRLDTEEGAKRVREGGAAPAIVPGRPGRSELVRRITSDDPEIVMPPTLTHEGSGGDPLSRREIAILVEWVEQGAEWEQWWAYRPVERPKLPTVETSPEFVRNPIDRFVLARMEAEGLAPELGPSPAADRATLIRRLSLDLTGIPPSADHVIRFEEDPAEGAYEQVVDSLLASPHFGERMAVWWLDLVRYAETDGYHSDLHREISAYRDYVVEAFNANKPFDQFTREQIAGDLIPGATRAQRIAAAYNRLGQATKEGGSQPKEYLNKYQVDRVNTLSNTWLASSMECAQCHDHKYDPFTQEDFYELAAFFGDVKERGLFPNENQLPPQARIPGGETADSLRVLAKDIAHLDGRVDRIRRSGRVVPAATADRLAALIAEERDLLERTPQVLATASVEPRVVRFLPRGDWRSDEGPIVQPDVPEFLPAMQVTGRRPDRLDLADWLVSEDNPLTPRAFVNQLWRGYFGTALSRRVGDFGVQGEWPSHPELLDWLAAEFVESGWNVKHLVRLIVTSGTYRQSSAATETLLERDPENRLLARQSRFRLPAEIVRDNALAVSGLLNRSVGGESVKPYQPEDYWTDIQTFGETGPAAEWTATEGPDQYRRGLYTYWKRSFLHPTLKAFDASTRQHSVAMRSTSNTPRQGLALLNDPIFVEAARVFAQRILEEGGSEDAARIRFAVRTAVARAPSAAEIGTLTGLLERQRTRYGADPEAAREAIEQGQFPIPESVDAPELASWMAVGRAVLNLHETITRY